MSGSGSRRAPIVPSFGMFSIAVRHEEAVDRQSVPWKIRFEPWVAADLVSAIDFIMANACALPRF